MAGVSDLHRSMLIGDREPNASVVAVTTPDVENGKRRRSCPQICLFVQVFSVQNIPDMCWVSCLSKCVAYPQSLCCCWYMLLVVTEDVVNRKRESCSSCECFISNKP